MILGLPFGGLKVISTPLALHTVAMSINVIVPSRHRSKRVWKKLVKRRMESARAMSEPASYMVGDTLYAHPVFIERMKAMSNEPVAPKLVTARETGPTVSYPESASRCVLRHPELVIKHCFVA